MPAGDDLDDIWTFGPRDSTRTPRSGPALTIELIDCVEPLDGQFGVEVPKTVPDALYDALFGLAEPSKAEIETANCDAAKIPPLHTYAILDAAKVPNLPEMLEVFGLEHRCLFKGAAYDDMKGVAPWIVRLEEGNHFTRNLFTRSDAPWHMWDAKPGIYLRSRGTLKEIWSHFRKFIKFQDDYGKQFYFRFWDPVGAANPLFDYMSYEQELCEPWFCLPTGSQITRYVYQTYKDGLIKSIRLADAFQQTGQRRFFVYTKHQKDHGIRYLVEWRCYAIAQRIKQAFAVELVDIDTDQIHARLLRCVGRMQTYGIRQQEYLMHIFIWDLLIGEAFETKVGYERVMDILQSRKREPLKFDMVKNVMIDKKKQVADG